MKRGVWLLLAVLLLASVANAFEIDVTPKSIYATVQAGGYVSDVVELHTDRPVQVLAQATPILTPLIRLTRSNDTTLIIHFLPPQDAAQVQVKGQLILDVVGEDNTISAGLQHVQIPVDVTINIDGRAAVPAKVDLAPGEDIRIVPLSSDSVTVLVIAIAGIVMLNIILRTGRKRRK